MAIDEVNWWAGAGLYLRSGKRGVASEQLFRGRFLEAINIALARPDDERSRLFIRCEADDKVLPWARLAELASRPDFPVII